jgi:hypothetical protein
VKYLGDFAAGATVRCPFNVVLATGESSSRATNGTVRIYKNSSTTQRTSSNGITDTEDFDSLTGLGLVVVDLSDNTDAGFYAAGNDYFIVLDGVVIDGVTVNSCIGFFSIENRYSAGGGGLDAAGVRAAIGLASANLDTQLAAIDDSVDTEVASIVSTLATILALIDTEVAAIKAKTDNLPSDPADASDIAASFATLTAALPTTAAIADKLLGRAIQGGTDGGRTVTSALRAIRNKVSESSGVITVCEEDDTTAAWTAAATRDLTAGSLTAVDPA